jgi:hypothetical protein
MFHWFMFWLYSGTCLIRHTKGPGKCVRLYSMSEYSGFILVRERPFNLKGGGGLWFFLKKYSDSQCCWKKYSDFGGGKKKLSDSEFLSYNLMLNSGKKFCALHDKKNKYSNSLVVQKKKSEWKKNHKPPCKLNGRSLNRNTLGP